MKNLVLGCALSAILLVIFVAVAGYFLVYRPFPEMVAAAATLNEAVASLKTLDATITTTAPFSPPADGRLTEDQVRRFAETRTAMHTAMGTRASALKTSYETLDPPKDVIRYPHEYTLAYRDFFVLLRDAKQAQVIALNAHGFSATEYAWVRSRVYEAAHIRLPGLDLRAAADRIESDSLTETLEDIRRTVGPLTPKVDATGSAPAANVALVAPYVAQLRVWYMYAAFGL